MASKKKFTPNPEKKQKKARGPLSPFDKVSAGTRICGLRLRYGSRICSSTPGMMLTGMLSYSTPFRFKPMRTR